MSLILRQLFEKQSSTYTYILFDKTSREAALVDPVQETMERDLQILDELEVHLKYILDTHVHADHITSSGKIREARGGVIGVSHRSQVETADQLLRHGDRLPLGDFEIQVLETPGHTLSCLCFYSAPYLLTGDTLLIRGCGRTDFQEGSSSTLFHSVRDRLFNLPDETLVYPGHDYKGRTVSTILEEKKWNPRLNMERSEDEFVAIMAGLNLAPPRKIDEAVPANLKSGL